MQTTNIFLKQTEKFSIFLMTVFFSIVTFAQESTPDLKVDVNSTKTTSTEEWFTNPLYWVIGALILIVLIAVIARGGGRRD